MNTPLRFASVCDGISAVGCAWKPLGWQFVFKSEIEPFPSAVADHHHPEAPNLGDMTKFEEWYDAIIDVLCGGTPCQGFSIAGLRGGLDDPRSQLSLTFGEIAARYRPRWLVWENVPGVLSSNGGKDFAEFLGLITGRKIHPPAEGWENSGVIEGIPSAYGIAWRVLDAQYFGVAQRRRRVFVVGHIGGLWQRAAAVLFERDCLSGNPAPRRQPGQGATYDAAPCLGASGRGVERAGETRGQDPVGAITSPVGASFGNDARSGRMRGREGCEGGGKGPLLSIERSLTLAAAANDQVLFQEVAPNLTINGEAHSGFRDEHGLIAHSLRAEGFDASEDGTGRGTPLVPEVLAHGQGNAERVSDGSPSLTCNHEAPIAFLPFDTTQITSKANVSNPQPGHPCHPLAAGAHAPAIAGNMAVRRLTPRECERLQGFPDDYTLIQFRKKPAADGPRYKSLGNSMAVPVMRWIGERIQQVEDL